MTPQRQPGWWIATDNNPVAAFLGPFATRRLALEVRGYVEKVRHPQTFWVIHVKRPAREVQP